MPDTSGQSPPRPPRLTRRGQASIGGFLPVESKYPPIPIRRPPRRPERRSARPPRPGPGSRAGIRGRGQGPGRLRAGADHRRRDPAGARPGGWLGLEVGHREDARRSGPPSYGRGGRCGHRSRRGRYGRQERCGRRGAGGPGEVRQVPGGLIPPRSPGGVHGGHSQSLVASSGPDHGSVRPAGEAQASPRPGPQTASDPAPPPGRDLRWEGPAVIFYRGTRMRFGPRAAGGGAGCSPGGTGPATDGCIPPRAALRSPPPRWRGPREGASWTAVGGHRGPGHGHGSSPPAALDLPTPDGGNHR